MRKRAYVPQVLLLLAFCATVRAQGTNPCAVAPTGSESWVGISANKVACTLPQLYGGEGLAIPLPPLSDGGPVIQNPITGNGFTGAQAQQNAESASINSNVAGQIALLPLVAPASGITLTLDTSLGIYTVAQLSFGPIFSERATMIGARHLALGVSYQHLSFNSLGGINLRSFPTTFTQEPFNAYSSGDTNCPSDLEEEGLLECRKAHDYVAATNRIDVTLQQLTSFVTFGLTRRVDISVAIPYVQSKMSATANATIVENSGSYGSTTFDGCYGNYGDTSCGLQETFFNTHSAAGLGDVDVRAKGTIMRWEHSGLAAGVNVRTPTGDAINFLGSGAWGVRPFAVWSYEGRISPHVNVGYEWNGQSILGGDVTSGQSASLPSQFIYSLGGEGMISRRFTATLDLLGQRVFNAPIDSLVSITVPSPCNPAVQPTSPAEPTSVDACLPVGSPSTTVGISTGSYGINNADIGVRVRPFGRLLITASVLMKLDNGGLRSTAIPMAAATYEIR